MDFPASVGHLLEFLFVGIVEDEVSLVERKFSKGIVEVFISEGEMKFFDIVW